MGTENESAQIYNNMKQLLPILFIALFPSCNTMKRAAKTFDNHPKESAQYCAVNHPVKPFTKTVIRTVKGKPDTVTYTQTYTIDCDSALKANVRIVKAPCPPTQTIYETDTVYTHDTTVIENTAVTEALHYELADKTTIAENATVSARKWRDKALWTWGVLALIIGGGVTLKVAKNKIAKKLLAAEKLV